VPEACNVTARYIQTTWWHMDDLCAVHGSPEKFGKENGYHKPENTTFCRLVCSTPLRQWSLEVYTSGTLSVLELVDHGITRALKL
jgi:hypothetical protein